MTLPKRKLEVPKVSRTSAVKQPSPWATVNTGCVIAGRRPEPGMPIQPKSLRLNLRTSAAPPSRFDGGWWPRSPDLLAELPTLIRVLTTRLGVIRKITYNIDTWGPLARRMVVDDQVIRLEGFPGQDRYSLRITGVTPGVLCLLVIPSDTTEMAGNAALAAALTQNGFSREILAVSGVTLAGAASTRR